MGKAVVPGSGVGEICGVGSKANVALGVTESIGLAGGIYVEASASRDLPSGPGLLFCCPPQPIRNTMKAAARTGQKESILGPE